MVLIKRTELDTIILKTALTSLPLSKEKNTDQ
jgi:hypothetical protein